MPCPHLFFQAILGFLASRISVFSDDNLTVFQNPYFPRLVKPRTKHGVPLFEVEWVVSSASELADLWKGYPNEFSTLESQQVKIFSSILCYFFTIHLSFFYFTPWGHCELMGPSRTIEVLFLSQ